MTVLGDRTRKRRDEMNLSQHQLADLVRERLAPGDTVTQQALDLVERGQTRRPKFLRELAAALCVSEDYLQGKTDDPEPILSQFIDPGRSSTVNQLQNELSQKPRKIIPRIFDVEAGRPKDLPVLGRAVGGAEGWFEFNGQPLDYVYRPQSFDAVRQAYALFVDGDSMAPRYEPGETIFVNPTRPVRIGDYVVVQVKQKAPGEPIRALVKKLIRRTSDRIVLKSLNPPDSAPIELPADQVILHRIVLGGEA